MKTILFVTPFFPPSIGGAETSIYTLVTLLRRKGYKCKVISYKCVNTWLFNKLEGHKVLQVLHLVPLLLLKTWLYLLFNYRKVGVVHCAGCCSSVVGRLIPKPYTVSTHCIYEGIYKLGLGERWLFSGAKTILCLTRESMNEVGLSNCVEYRTLVDWEVFHPMKVDPLPKFTVLFTARPIAKKGWDSCDQGRGRYLVDRRRADLAASESGRGRLPADLERPGSGRHRRRRAGQAGLGRRALYL